MMKKYLLFLLVFSRLSIFSQVTTKDTLNSTDLDEVIITAYQKYGEKKSFDISKMPLKNIENPHVYSIIPKEIIKNQILLTNREIINNAVGVVAFNNPVGAVTAWIRGFETRNSVRNGMATQFRAESDPINIERMEVVKGPEGTLYGAQAVSFGGLINKVTKEPFENSYAETSLYLGSYGLSRLTADINNPLNKNKSALFRLNAAYRDENSFQDIGYYKNITIAPSFLYKINDHLAVNIDLELVSVKNTQMPYPNLSGGYFKNFKDIPLAYNKYIGGDDVDSKANIKNIFIKTSYKISDVWTSFTNINSSVGAVDFSYQLYPRWTSPYTIERNVGLYSARKLSFFQIQQNFNADTKILGLKNKILLGADYTENNAKLNFQMAKYDDIDVRKDFSPIIRTKIDAILGEGTAGHYDNTEQNTSIYASDVLNFTKDLSILLSGRLDYFYNKPSIANNISQDDGYSQFFFSPKVGVVYQLLQNKLSLFGNYMNGFINQGPVSQPDGSQLRLKPEKAYQKELGVKTQFFQKKLFSTLSFYEIKVNDATWTDLDNFTYQSGSQKSKGFEYELIAQLRNISLIAGVAYNENRFTAGEAPLIGKLVKGSPKNIYNFWIDYQIPKGALKNVRIGAGGNYVSSVYWDAINSIIIPNYFVLNTSVVYELKNWNVGVKINNITNQKYWNSDGQPQQPTNLIANLSFNF